MEWLTPLLEQYKFPLIGAGAVVVVLLGLALLRRGRRPAADPEAGLDEDLGTYPPPPAVGPVGVTVDGVPARVRLAVVAPMGREPLTADQVAAVLNLVVRGLGEVVKADRARVRAWPPQLSATAQSFAATFARHTRRPAHEKGRWVLMAGPARAGKTPVLVGLAVYAEGPTGLDVVPVPADQWARLLAVD